MSFADGLKNLGGDLTGTLTDLGGKYLELRIAKEKAAAARGNVTNPSQNIQPALPQPTQANPTKGVDSNGETIVVGTGGGMPLLKNKAVVYGGMAVGSAIVLAILYKLVK